MGTAILTRHRFPVDDDAVGAVSYRFGGADDPGGSGVPGSYAAPTTGPLAVPVGIVGRGPAVAALPRTLLRPGDDVPALLTRLYATAVRGHGTVHVVQLTEASAWDIGGEFVAAGAIFGETVTHHERSPGALAPDPDSKHRPRGTRVDAEIVSVRRRLLDGPAVEAVKHAQKALLVVETRTRPAVAEDAAQMLRFLGVGLLGLIAWRGRIPRDPMYGFHA